MSDQQIDKNTKDIENLSLNNNTQPIDKYEELLAMMEEKYNSFAKMIEEEKKANETVDKLESPTERMNTLMMQNLSVIFKPLFKPSQSPPSPACSK